MSNTPANDASTRERIVTIADGLFYEGGFEATSFAAMAEMVGISRGNFYHHFRTKDALLDAVIAARLSYTREMIACWDEENDAPHERIVAFMRMLAANRDKIAAFGCPVGSLCGELAKKSHAAHSDAAAVMDLFRFWLTEQFAALGAGSKAEGLALHLLTWSQGVAVLASAYCDENFIEREVAATEAWLSTLKFAPQPPMMVEEECS